MDRRLGADVSAAAGAVLDDELLAEPLEQPLADQARHDVVHAAGGEADNETNGVHGVDRNDLRAGGADPDGCGDCDRGQAKE